MRALVTGINSFVNRVLADKLVAMGYAVLGHYHSDNELTAELKQIGSVELLQADFTDPKSIELFMNAVKKAGPFDVIVNGAACYTESDSWEAQLS